MVPGPIHLRKEVQMTRDEIDAQLSSIEEGCDDKMEYAMAIKDAHDELVAEGVLNNTTV